MASRGFFDEIVTSSPIQDRDKTAPFNQPVNMDYPTWSSLLHDYQVTPRKRYKEDAMEIDPSLQSSETSSSYQPIAEHTTRVLLTPGRKLHIISNSTRKFKQKTPARPSSYSRLNHAYRQRFDDEETDEPSIATIREKLKHKETLTADQLEKYENVLKKYISKQSLQKEEPTEPDELMDFVEQKLGKLNLSPESSRLLKMQKLTQEKRLISLSIAKRKSSHEIKKRINEQQVMARQQIKNRERIEMKLMKASHLRQKALTASTMFPQVHGALHKRVVKETQLKGQVDQLQRKIQSEKTKNSQQATQIVRDVWSTFLQEQYNELRNDIRRQQQEQKAVVKESENQLERYKLSYEEKLNELKLVATTKAAEAGIEKKEVKREIERIQRTMQSQFQSEFQNLLHKIGTKGDHTRLLREEKASRLKGQLQMADYVFDV